MKTLLSVLISIACGFAINQVLVITESIPAKFCYAISFLAVIMRFYEGNVIFYNKVHRRKKSNPRDNIYTKGRMDLYFIFSQFFVFCAMGNFIGELKSFMLSFVTLNLLDVIWHAFAFFKADEKSIKKISLYWCISNLVLGLVISAFLIVGKSLYTKYNQETLIIFTLVGIIAAVSDYCFNKEFYFDKEAKKVFEDF